MSFRFTPGCCCQKNELYPCIPDCQEIFSGFYNQIYYEGHTGQSGVLPGKDDSASYDSNSYITINLLDSYDKTGPDCGLFVVTRTRNSSVSDPRFYFRASLTDKTIRDLTSSQYGTHYIGRFLTTYTYTGVVLHSLIGWSVFDVYDSKGEIQRSSVHTGGITTAKTRSNNWIDEKDYRNYIRVYSYDGFYHSIKDINYTRLFCLPFDICEYPFKFSYNVASKRWDNPLLLITKNSQYTQLYLSFEGKEETEDCELSCSFTTRDTCAAQVPSEYATIFNASDIATALNSLTNDNIIDYWTVRLYGVCTPSNVDMDTGKYTRFFEAAEFGVVVVWTSDGTKVPVVMGNISVSNCALTFANFDTGYNTSSNNIDYPTLLISYSHLNESTGELTYSSIVSNSGTMTYI